MTKNVAISSIHKPRDKALAWIEVQGQSGIWQEIHYLLIATKETNKYKVCYGSDTWTNILWEKKMVKMTCLQTKWLMIMRWLVQDGSV